MRDRGVAFKFRLSSSWFVNTSWPMLDEGNLFVKPD